jgi:cell wall-associated NlpC family hydrolase
MDMSHQASPSPRVFRAFAALVTAASVVLVAPLAASAAGSAPSSGPASGAASLQVQAQEIADQVEADGIQLDQLDNLYSAALMRYQSLEARQAQLDHQMAQTARLVAVDRQALEEQALLGYMAGGGPVVPYIPGKAGSDPSLTLAYTEIIGEGRQQALQSYNAALALQSGQRGALRSQAAQASIALDAARSDQSSADQTLIAERRTLSQVKGRLAAAVAAAQASQQAAEEAAVKASLARQGQLPPSTPSTASANLTGTRASGGALRSAPTTTAAPAPSAVTPTPVATAAGGTRTNAAPTTTVAPPETTPPTTQAPSPPTAQQPSGPSPNTEAPGANLAVAYARAQLGKPYQWAASGPNSFDCSGLTMMAWEQAGVYLVHNTQYQYEETERIPLADALPGDLIFYGTPDDVFHVGLYIGNGDMIAAPETGQDVQIESIYWSGLLGAGRVLGGHS